MSLTLHLYPKQSWIILKSFFKSSWNNLRKWFPLEGSHSLTVLFRAMEQFKSYLHHYSSTLIESRPAPQSATSASLCNHLALSAFDLTGHLLRAFEQKDFIQLSGRILPRLFINSKQIGFLRIGWWMPTNDCISLYNHLFFQVNLVAMKMIHKKVDNYGETFFLPSMYT